MKTLGQVEYRCLVAARVAANAETTNAETHDAQRCGACQFLVRLEREMEALRQRRLKLLAELKKRLRGQGGDIIIVDLR